MENKFRNEMEIQLGSQKILLRPTFENISAMESNVGALSWLVWKYSRGVKFKDGQIDRESLTTETSIKAIPAVSEAAQIIYYNQAATKMDDPNQKKHSLEEIWDMVMEEGSFKIAPKIVEFLGRIARGDKTDKVESLSDLSESEKKSSS